MPECATCENTDFEQVDGLYYCTICQTQSQDLRKEEITVSVETFEKSFALKGNRQKKKDKGRPWTIYEGYQCVLKEQVKALVRLGADPILEDVVFRLWALYLSKLQVAFCQEEKQIPEDLKQYARCREKYRGGMENPDVTGVRMSRGWKKKHINSAEKAEQAVERASLAVSLQSEEFYKGDNPAEVTTEESDFYSESEDKDSKEKEIMDEDEEKQTAKRRKNVVRGVRRKTEWMNLSKTLSFCHLALMFTNNLTMASDLIRWVQQCEIPFIEVSWILPDDMKFSSMDVHLFKAEIPTPENLRVNTSLLAKFLDIQDFPSVPVSLLISRYILLLDLPGEMHGLVMNIVRKNPPKMKYDINYYMRAKSVGPVPNYEAVALSYIIITLKLLYGLDDLTERELSTYARELTELINNKYTLFVFEDWKAHVNIKLSNMASCSFLFNKSSLSKDITDYTSVDVVLDNYLKSNQHTRRQPYCHVSKRNGHVYRTYSIETKKALQRPFVLLSEKWEKKKVFTLAKTSSVEDELIVTSEKNFEDESNLLNDSSVAHLDQGQCSTESQGHIGDAREKDLALQDASEFFRGSTLKHVTHPETFLEELDRQGLTSFDNSDEDDASDHDVEMNESRVHRKKNCHTQGSRKSAVKAKLKEVLKKTATKERKLDGKIAKIMKKFRKAYENYVLYDDVCYSRSTTSYSETRRHKCYDWLLNLCAALIGSSVEQIEECVFHLQAIYITCKRKYVGVTKRSKERFQKKYF